MHASTKAPASLGQAVIFTKAGFTEQLSPSTCHGKEVLGEWLTSQSLLCASPTPLLVRTSVRSSTQMLFNSLTFVVFFAVVLAAYWTLKSWNARKNLLLVASYIFYGAWNPPFALLLFATTALDFYLGSRIAQAKQPSTRKAWMIASVTSNLSMLGFFKYGNFLLENTQWLLARAGIAYQPPHLEIFLPIGISFYTFHSLSYTLDVYRRVCDPTKSLRDFTLAVSFFPQWWPGRSCAPPIFFHNSRLPGFCVPGNSAGACC